MSDTDSTNDPTWVSHYRKTESKPPHGTLLFALEKFDAEERADRVAVDLGCGAGTDCLELLHRGWTVTAVDVAPQAIEHLGARVTSEVQHNLELVCSDFRSFQFPNVDLVNASLSLPLCPPGDFQNLWKNIDTAIRPTGRFAGHFFGPNDGWNYNEDLNFKSEAEIRALLKKYEVELFTEVEEDGFTALGKAKHWHFYTVVARKQDREL